MQPPDAGCVSVCCGQRDKLSKETNVLYMTATPIARSMTLMYYSNMEVSQPILPPSSSHETTL